MRFDFLHFNDTSFSAHDRAETLPRLAAIAFSLTSTATPTAKGKRIAIQTAEQTLRFMRGTVATKETV